MMLEMLKGRPWVILTAYLPRSPSAKVRTTLAPTHWAWTSDHASHLCFPEAWPLVTLTSPVDSFLGECSIKTFITTVLEKTPLYPTYRWRNGGSAKWNDFLRPHSERDRGHLRPCYCQGLCLFNLNTRLHGLDSFTRVLSPHQHHPGQFKLQRLVSAWSSWQWLIS